MLIAKTTHTNIEKPGFGTVKNPIAVMIQDHDNENERYKKISLLSNNYTPPEDACNSYKKTFSLLQEFDNDLHVHMDLENNILFPKAVELEREFINL
jgi:regulator of cell morphogenesis and NO signaling